MNPKAHPRLGCVSYGANSAPPAPPAGAPGEKPPADEAAGADGEGAACGWAGAGTNSVAGSGGGSGSAATGSDVAGGRRGLGRRFRRGCGERRGLLVDALGLHRRLLRVLAVALRQPLDARAAAGDRRGGGRDRGQLLAGRQLGRRVGALAEGGCLVVRGAHDRLDQAAQPARPIAARAGRHERRRHESGDPRRSRPVLAQARAAGEACLEVRPQGGELLGAGLAVGQGGQQRLEALALGARLDPLEPVEEGAPALAQAAVHLRVAPAGDLADLLVGVALRPQQQAADLLRLQPPSASAPTRSRS